MPSSRDNPYRRILRRRHAWPLLLALAMVWGYWIAAPYFGPVEENPDAARMTWLKTERDGMLAEAMAGDPAWLGWLAGAKPRTAETRVFAAAPESQLRALRQRALLGRGFFWGVMAAGVCWLPQALRGFIRGATARAGGYSGHWSLTLGLTVFLSATLAWLGFSGVLTLGLLAIPQPPDGLLLALDVAMRLLPALIATGILFRRIRHVRSVWGLDREPPVAPVLGAFALLMGLDALLAHAAGDWGGLDSAGGLNALDSGGFGLVTLVVSACLVAPLAEEILYRGVLFRSLANRYGAMPGALFSALAFSLIHAYSPYGLASLILLGLACSLLYSATGRLSAAIALHMLYNAALKLPEWLVYHAPLS